MRSERWDNAGWLLFGSGWGFIVPYLFVALAGAWLGAAVPVVLVSFQALHLVIGGFFLLWAGSRLRHLSAGFLLLSVSMALLFLLPGAYLEFPSDPWDHYRRIFDWGRQQGDLTHAALVDELGFLWNASLVSWVPPSGHRLALDLVSAFWQLLLGWQFYRLFRRFGEPVWAGVQVIGTVALFGTNVFAFYRYYALAATPLAYIAYLQGLIAVCDILDRGIPKASAEEARTSVLKPVGVLCLCVLLIYYNHFQELMLLGISSAALVFARLWEHPGWRRPLVACTAGLFAVSLPAGGWVVSTYQKAPTPWGPAFEEMPHVSMLGTFRLWDLGFPYFETLGLHGVIGLCGAVVLFGKHPRLASLTLAPVVLALFPPFVFLFGAVYPNPTYGYITYRVLFAFPASVMLIEGLLAFWRALKEGQLLPGWRVAGPAVVTLAILVIGLFPDLPLRGRLWFHLYGPPPVLALSGTEEMAEWFLNHPEWEGSCVTGGDHATQWVLATHFGTEWSERLVARNIGSELASVGELRDHLRSRDACGLLVAIPETSIPLSTVAQKSAHWDPPMVRADLSPPEEFLRLLEQARMNGWREIEVPPFYKLYVPPRETDGGDV